MTTSVNHVYNMRRGNRKRYTKQTYDMAHIMHHAIKQVLMNRTLNKWGKQVDHEISKEIKQFHTIDAFLPFDPPYMEEDYNTTTLKHLLLLKKHWDLSIKEG